ncbi:MAG: flavodoxin family protein [Methanomassiliicoccales archaeon]
MVRVVGLMGSPRKGGNTDMLLDRALEGAREAGGEVEKVTITDLDLKGCQECCACSETGKCVIMDDMQRIYTLLEELDALIVASPVFFSGLSSQTKMVVDRCQAIWARKYLLKRRMEGRRLGAFLSVGGRKDSDFSNALSVVKVFFLNIDVEFFDSLTVPGVDGKGAILERREVLDSAYRMGRDLVEAFRIT